MKIKKRAMTVFTLILKSDLHSTSILNREDSKRVDGTLQWRSQEFLSSEQSFLKNLFAL
jgi:hypothetical protein